MIQLLIALALVVILYSFFFGGNETTNETAKDQPTVQYQQQVEKIKGLEQSMQQAVDLKMRNIDQRTSEK